MTDYAQLGKRLVACKHFRWMPGMLTLDGERVIAIGDFGLRLLTIPESTRSAHADVMGWWPKEAFSPDLSDAATKGCVMELIREAHQDRTIYIGLGCFGWVILNEKNRIADTVHHAANFDSEEESLVVAMEAAP